MSFKAYSKIPQFRNVIRAVKDTAKWNGVEDLPTIKFHGSQKLHGTNSCVSYNYGSKELSVQKRTGCINVGNDNFGFALWVEKHRDKWIKVFEEGRDKVEGIKSIHLFGEWAGKGIQKGVGISKHDKSFFAFQASVTTKGNLPGDEDLTVIQRAVKPNAFELEQFQIPNLYDITDFKMFEIDIDFNKPALSQNQLIDFTLEIEKECQVSKQLGLEGELIGEGIVWVSECGSYKFKSKGEKHQSSKVKTLVPVDIEKIKSIEEFVDNVVTENRLNQGLENIDGLYIKNMGKFLSWIFKDVIDEELDVIVASGLEKKDYSKAIAKKAKLWYIKKLNEDAGL